MLFVYKLTKFFVKLFVKVVLLPVKLLAKLVGNDAAAGMAGGFADSLTSDEGGGDDEATTQRTQTRAGDAAGRPRQEGAVGTLSWVGSFLADRPELFVPALALGVVRAILVGPTTPAAVTGSTGAESSLASLVTMAGGLFVGGMVVVAVGDSFGGRHRDLSGLASAATSGLLSAFGVAVAVVLGASVLGGVLGGIGVLVLGPAAVVLALPVLYVVLRVALAVPAVFLGGRGAVDALRESWSLSSGNVLTLAGIALVAGLTAALGVVPTVGTALATTVGTPLWMASLAHVYLGTGGGVARATPGASSTSGRSGRDVSTGGEPAAWNQSDAGERQRQSAASGDSLAAEDSAGAGRPTGSTESAADDAVESESTTADNSDVDRDSASTATGSALVKDSSETAEAAAGTDEASQTEAERAEEGGAEEASAVDEPEADAAADEVAGEETEPGEATEATADAADADSAEGGASSLPEEDGERVALVAAAVESGDASPEHLDALTDALDADDPAVRRDAAEALGDLAVAEPAVADEAVAALRDCRLDPEVEVSEAASAALDRAREAT